MFNKTVRVNWIQDDEYRKVATFTVDGQKYRAEVYIRNQGLDTEYWKYHYGIFNGVDIEHVQIPTNAIKVFATAIKVLKQLMSKFPEIKEIFIRPMKSHKKVMFRWFKGHSEDEFPEWQLYETETDLIFKRIEK